MKKSIKVDRKKAVGRRGRPPTGRDPMMLVSSKLPGALVGEVDGWAAANEATRSEAIRRLVELGLKAKR
jgi:hypothetical protein